MKVQLLIIGFLLIFLMFLSYQLKLPWIEFFELKTMDMMYSMRGEIHPKNLHTVIVGIDEKSLASFEEGVYSPIKKKVVQDYWPWSREKFAWVIMNLIRAGAKAVLIDVSFTNPSEEDPKGDTLLMSVLNIALNKKVGVVIGTYLINRKETFMLYGKKMKEELEKNTYYLRYAYLMKHYRELELLRPIRVYKVRPPIAKFSMVAPSASYEVGSPDIDGTIRTLPLFIEEVWANETGRLSGFLPHMDVLGTAFYLGEDPIKPVLAVDFKDKVVEIGKDSPHKIPFDSYGLFHILYYGRGRYTFPTVSFVDVYKGKVDLKKFKGKIVLIGYTATAKGLYDLRKTPFSTNEAGIYIHATAVENMIEGKSLMRFPLIFKLIMVTTVLIISGLFFISNNLSLNALSLIIVPVLITLGYFMFLKGFYIDVFYPIFSSVVLSAYGIGMNVRKSIQERKRFREFLYRYLDESVADQIMKSGKRELENEKKKVVVLFSDIRGFTSLSEKMDPEEIVNMLNAYFDRMSMVIKSNRGMIDKFIGDAIMAIFGVPFESDDDVRRALKAALEMRRELKKFREETGYDIDNGIGLHYGEVVVGNIGASFRWDYTCIGDTVNTASRVESLTRKVNAGILVTQEVYEKEKDEFVFEYVGDFQVKGKSEKISVYRLVSENE